MSHDPMVICDECNAKFSVIWQRSIETLNGPEHCPFCGSEIDYRECLEKREEESV